MLQTLKTLLVSCLTILVVQSSKSQDIARWQWINPRPTPNNLTDLQMLDAQTGWAVGYFGTILKTEDGGQTWNPQFSEFTNHLNGVHFQDANHGWIAGNEGMILKTTDSGIHWNQVSGVPINVSFTDIQILNSSTVVAITKEGKIFRTTDGGQNWTDVPLSQSNALTKLQFVNQTTGWAVGAGGRILKTTNAGAIWVAQSANNVGTYFSLCMLNENLGWITSAGSTIYKTTNGGQNWTSVSVGNFTLNITSIDFLNSNIGIVGIDNTNIRTTTDGGQTWQSQSPIGSSPGQIKILGPTKILYVGSGGRTGRSTNFGQNWTNNSVDLVQNLNGLEIVGESTLYTSTYGKILKSTDGGFHWQSITIPVSGIASKIRFTTKSIGYAMGSGFLLKTMDEGISWNLVNFPSGFSLYDFQFVTPEIGWAVGNNSIVCRTFNGGLDWQFSNYSATENFTSVDFLSHTTGFAASSAGKIFKSTNRGESWELVGLSVFTKINMFDELNGVGYYFSHVGKTTDGGITWTNLTDPGDATQFEFVNKLNGWAVGSFGIIHFTTNGGISWKYARYGNSDRLTCLKMLNSKLGYAVGDAGRILRFSLVPGLAQKQNLVKGTIFRNKNNDCSQQPDELPIKENVVIASPGPVFGLSNGNGKYEIPLDSGSYQISQIIPSLNQVIQTQYCPVNNGSYPVAFPSNQDTVLGQVFGNNITECPLMNVSVGSTRRRRCSRNTTTITYSNSGFGASAGNSTISLKFPAYVNLINASMPYVYDATSGVYQFAVGAVAPGTGGSILITDSVSCVAGISGTEQCTKAWITPGNTCVPSPPGWDGVNLKVTGQCLGQTPTFIIKNIGSAMTTPRAFRVFVDSLFAYSSDFILGSNDSVIVQVPVTSQHTSRVEVPQSPYHPFSTFAAATAYCGGIPRFSTLGSSDEDPIEDVDCMPIRDSYDPNDKTPSPKGNTSAGNIEPKTLIEYKIRFQNTGTDTAYKVVIVDTLPSKLDIRSLEMGAFSHPYQFNVSGKGRAILIFTFPNIYLPDSNVNELASNGFVSFRIRPFGTLPLGTSILNSAEIYFDYNEPVKTNQTRNTLFEPVLTPGLVDNVTVITGVGPQTSRKTEIDVFPNPATGVFTIRSNQPGQFRIVNLLGEQVTSGNLESGTQEVDVQKLKHGIYFLDLQTPGGREVKKLVLK